MNKSIDFAKPFLGTIAIMLFGVFSYVAVTSATKNLTQNSAGAILSQDSSKKINPPQTQSFASCGILVSDQSNHRVQAFSTNGTYTFKWGNNGTGNSQFQFPVGITTDQLGNVYVADRNNYRIQKFTSTGTYSAQWGNFGIGNGQFKFPFGIAMDYAGNVYVTDRINNTVQKFTSAGTYLSQWGSAGTGNGQFNSMSGIAISPMGDVFIVDTDNHRVQKFNSAGIYVSQWGNFGSGNGQFQAPSGIAIDSAGNVYVADTGNNRIQKFNSTGVYISQWGTTGAGNGQFSLPNGVTVDSTGSVYVTDTWNSRVEKFDQSGNYISQWGISGTGDGQFNHPIGITPYCQPATTNTTGDKIFLMGGLNSSAVAVNDVWSSLNVTNWTLVSPNTSAVSMWSARPLQNNVVYFQNRIWVLGDKNIPAGSNDIWSSYDGSTWINSGNAAWPPRHAQGAVVFQNKLWIMGGQSVSGSNIPLNDVWSSPDGINWTQQVASAPWSPRANFGAVVFGNKMWVIGGTTNNGGGNTNNFNDIWSSPDGITWTQQVINAPWAFRGYHAVTVFNNKIWLTGGFSPGVRYDDVWSSSDGINWIQVQPHAPWGERVGHSIFGYNNKLWLVAGGPGVPNVHNDVWSSIDGINWVQEVINAPWDPRFYQSVVTTPHSFGLGDIKITNINWDGPFHASSTYPYLQYDLTIQNIGTGSVTLPLTFKVTMTRPAGGTTVYSQLSLGTPVTLVPNQTYTFNNVTTVGSPNMRAIPTTWLLSAKADSSNVIDESNENNNTLVTSVTIVP